MKAHAVKQKRIAAEDVLLLFPHQMLGLVGVYLRPVLYPSDGDLFNTDMHVWTSLTTRCHSESKEIVVGSAEGAPILVFFPLIAAVRCFPTWFAALSRLELAQGLTMVMPSGAPY